jgi:epoxyqueuosine reductase
MSYLERNQELRYYPRNLLPGTQRIICVRLNCLPPVATRERLQDRTRAYIARYALGRDYHKVMRKRLNMLARRLAGRIGPFGYRAFVDSAPVLERQLAEKSGLGWIGKNTLLLHEQAGSWFLLGEIFTDLPLPLDAPQPRQRCGSCTACLDACPTQAFDAPFVLDPRRCVSYATIEQRSPSAPALWEAIGDHLFGCDVCQSVCPYNQLAPPDAARTAPFATL